jgi:hypothetical protein
MKNGRRRCDAGARSFSTHKHNPRKNEGNNHLKVGDTSAHGSTTCLRKIISSLPLAEELPTLADRYRQKLLGMAYFGEDDVPALRGIIASVTGGSILVEPVADGSTRVKLRGSWIGLYQALGQLPLGVDPETGRVTDWSSTGVLPCWSW